MEIGPVTRPGLPNPGSVSRVAAHSPADPVGVQLPATAVEQTSAAPKPQPDPARALADPDSIDRKIKIDPATQQVIYEAVDKSSGEVVRQIPEETMLRLQVYARAMRRAGAERRPGVSRNA